jgi:DNA-binding transcriptional LysR family regulator
LERFHKEFPTAHIKVTNETSVKCINLLETGQVDCIVINYPNSYLSNLYSLKKINKFKDVFVANNSFAELRDRKISFKELLQYPILMLEKYTTTSEFLHTLFQQHELDLVPEIELTSNDLLLDLAKIGLGIAFVPDYCISKYSDELFCLDMEEELPTRELAIVYNNRVPVSKATMEFLNYFH